jgi:plasmid stabilization system protein ParE
MKIKFLIAAEEHLDDIYNLIAEKSKQAAINLYNDFLDEIERLRDFPQMAAVEPVLINEPQIFRALVVRHNYKVIYYIEGDTIYIAAIWDCRQNPETNEKKIK